MTRLTADDIVTYATNTGDLYEEHKALAAFSAITRFEDAARGAWEAFVEDRVLPLYRRENGRTGFEPGALASSALALRGYYEKHVKEVASHEAEQARPGTEGCLAKEAGWQVHHDREGWYAVGPAEEHENGYGPEGDNLGFDGRAHFEAEPEAWADAVRLTKEGLDTNVAPSARASMG